MSQLKLTADSGGGTVAIKGPASTAGNAAIELTVPGTGSGTLAVGDTGKILQVLQTVKTDIFSTSSTSYTLITGLTQAITAASTSNKILINVTVYGGNSANEGATGFQLAKDGSVISGAIGAASGNSQDSGTMRIREDSSNHAGMGSFMFIDTPADTNSHTYGVLMKAFNDTSRVGTTGDNGNYNQHMRCPCTITVMEVAA